MPITRRTLTKWRKEALRAQKIDASVYDGLCDSLAKGYIEVQERILRLTQELLDIELMKGK